jgi:hypothetical protein
MAQHGIFGGFPRQCGLKNIDVIDALAGKRAFAEEILIDV